MPFIKSYHPRAQQEWTIGATVNVGFLKGLEVIEKVPTPGDHAPDAYVLFKDLTPLGSARQEGRFYRFVPHKGIERRDSLADARRA